MKKFYFKSSLLTLLLSGFAFGQGAETFESQTKLTNTYAGGNFNGETVGIVWDYTTSRNEDIYPITNKGILLQNTTSKLETTISNGIGKLSFDVRKAFTGGTNTRKIEILVNSVVVFTSPNFGTANADNTIHHYEVDINKTGSTVITFRNAGAQITLDNISWTVAPQITESPVVSTKTITGTYGVLLTDGTITATNNPTSWSQTGALPLGITFADGVFSGTPTQAGSFTSQVTATNVNGTSAPAEIKFEIAKVNQTIAGLVDLSQNSGTTYSSLPTVTDKGLPIVYSSSDNSIVSTTGNTLNFNGIGSTVITATALGNTNFNDYTTTFNVKSKDPNVVTYNGQGTFMKVNSLAEVTDGYYVVANEKDQFLMTNKLNTSSTNYLERSSFNLVSGKIENPSVNNVWKIETDGNNKTIYNEVLGTYAGWISGNSASLSSTLTNNYRWTFSYASSKFTVNNVADPERQLSYNPNTGGLRFAAYGNASQEELQLYKLVATSSTTWQNGIWSNGEADLTKDVIVKGNLDVNTAISAKTLTVSDAGGTVSVKSGGSLTVDGKIDNQAGLTGLVIENGGNLIQNQNVVNSGAITVNRNSQSMVRNDMTFWSSPVQDKTIRSFSPETLYNRFWTYNEATNEFSQILTSDTDSKLFEAGKGVSIRVKNTLATGANTIHNGVFTGVPFNGDITVPVQFTAGGYNLVGNPYASNINVEKFLAANTSVNSLYFWTHQFAVGSAEYANNYAAFTVAGSVIPGLTNISLGQGFIVGLSQATPTVSFNNAMRTAQDAKFYKNSTIEKNRIWLSLSKEDKPVSQILLAYMDGATNGIDNQIDAKVMQRGSSAIYTLINDEAYAIQGRSLPFKTDDVVKLGFEALEQGNYTINIEQVDGLFNENQTVYLKDKELNQVYNLSESAYKFASKAGEFNDRFELVYADKTLATGDLTKNNIVVYNTNNTIVVDSKQSKIVSVELYDIQGRRVVEKNKINSNSFQIQSSAKGVLVIKVLTEDGKVKTQKIVNK